MLKVDYSYMAEVGAIKQCITNKIFSTINGKLEKESGLRDEQNY